MRPRASMPASGPSEHALRQQGMIGEGGTTANERPDPSHHLLNGLEKLGLSRVSICDALQERVQVGMGQGIFV